MARITSIRFMGLVCLMGLASLAATTGSSAAKEPSRAAVRASGLVRSFDFNGNGRQEPVFGSLHRLLVYEAERGRLALEQRVKLDRHPAKFASGDLNRDGYADLVVGASATGGHGRVLVLLGTKSGLTKAGSYVVRGPADRFNFGMGLAIGDFDADGRSDIAVGAPDAYRPYDSSAAAVIVLRGGNRRYSLDRSYTLEPPDTSLRMFGLELATGDVNGDGVTDLVECSAWSPLRHLTWAPGSSLNRGLGQPQLLGAASSLATGDLTGDGIDDIVAGLSDGDAVNSVDGGAVVIYPGSPTGPGHGTRYSQDSPGVPGRSVKWDRFGAAVAVVNLDRDGFLDVAIGAPGEEVGDVKDAGRVTLLRGAETGLATRGGLQVDLARTGIPDRPRRYGQFGASLQTLDVNGRGRPELLVHSLYDAVADGDLDLDPALTVLFQPLPDGRAWDLRPIGNGSG